MTNNIRISCAMALAAACVVPAAANAALVMDTGTPGASQPLPMTLDGSDFYAAEFSLTTASAINSVSAYLLAGLDQPGATFTLAIYSDSGSGIGRGAADYTVQGTFSGNGWNTTSFGGAYESAGNYWVALEVSPGSSTLGAIGGAAGSSGAGDSALGLSVPTLTAGGGTAPALAFALNSGSGYTTAGALPFGIQVDATAVPLPPSAWLLAGGLLGLGGLARRQRVRGVA